MNDKKKKWFWILIISGVLFLFLVTLLSSILNVGGKIAEIHPEIGPYISYAFYLICAIVLWFLVINPLRIIIFSPSLSITTTLDCDTPKAHRIYKSVTKNILKHNSETLTVEEKNALTDYKNYEELRTALNLVMSGSIKKQIDRIIVRNAKTILLSTAISQNASLDMYSVITVNLNMIKEIVEVCGFRPNFTNLSKLTLNIASTALIAEGLENLKLEDILPNQTINSLNNIPLLKPILSSVTQGIANALLTIRIGLVTRGYLFTDSKKASKLSIRAEAFKDALVLLPIVIGEVLLYFPQKIVKLFTKDKKVESEEVNVVVSK